MSAGPSPAGVAAAVTLPTRYACAVASAIRCVAATAAASVLRSAKQRACPLPGVEQAATALTCELAGAALAGVGAACATDAKLAVVSVSAPAAARRSRRAKGSPGGWSRDGGGGPALLK